MAMYSRLSKSFSRLMQDRHKMLSAHLGSTDTKQDTILSSKLFFEQQFLHFRGDRFLSDESLMASPCRLVR
jgi:hypothetical protein